MASGLCECGCGGATPIAPYNSKRHGWVGGEPVRFIRGHNVRGKRPHNWKGGITANDPAYVRKPWVSGSDKYEHRAIAEKALGKPLPESAVVHHHGKETTNNGRNLVLCQDQAYHMLLHVRTRALKECGNANYRKCPFCHQYDDPTKMTLKTVNGNPYYFHTDCRNAYRRGRKKCQLAA